jgi:hypothetical protein
MPRGNEDLLLDTSTGVGDGLEGLAESRLASMLNDAPALVNRLLGGSVDDRADAHLIYRSVSAITARALADHNTAMLAAGIDAFHDMWTIGDAKAMYSTTTPDFEASLWESIVTELYALGGVAVANGRWGEMRSLILQQPGDPPLDRSWLRQGQTAGARASRYPDENVVELARRRFHELQPSSPGDELAAVARFDLLSALVISESDALGYYPNAAKFPASVVEPIVVDQLRDATSEARKYVFKGNDLGLREALRAYDERARTQAALARRHGHKWEWRAFEDARTLIFIVDGTRLEDFELSTR